MPQGWSPLWDPVGQRWAYLEQSVSKVIWTVPTGPSYPGAGYDASRGFGDQSQGGYGAPGGGYPGGQGGYGGYPDQQKKDDGKKNMMMGAAAGVAAGAIGGALIANALGKLANTYISPCM